MDHVCNGCDGQCEASVVWTCGVRRNFKWLIEEIEVVEEMIQKRALTEYLRYQPRVSVKLMAEDLGVNID
ncbi:hypothetical protein Taro_034245 [Colocasia esculenta]|uniref:Uncharacterized protein n=1 Tax=Colocasia esculenta TaxID=4460 RepID=A0A843VQS6_COLES|nr:hypothetical protein [Colocasia esculenta]